MNSQSDIDKEILDLSEQLKKFKKLAERVEDVQKISHAMAAAADHVIDGCEKAGDKAVTRLEEKLTETRDAIVIGIAESKKDRDETYANFVKCKEQFDGVLKRYNVESLVQELVTTQRSLAAMGVRLEELERKSSSIETNTTDAKDGITNLSETVAEGNGEIKTRIEGNRTSHSKEFEDLKTTTTEKLDALEKQRASDLSALTERLERSEKATKKTFVICSVLIVLVVVLLKFLSVKQFSF